jgi:D-alanyl-D-alanine carboxypeptidase (penicillin-binding protein 5/6)
VLRPHAILSRMMPLSLRQGRQRALLLFLLLLIILTVTLSGVARASTTTTLQAVADPQTSSITVKASDLGGFGAPAPVVASPSAIAVNLSTGKVLFQKDARTRRPMASTTKIMTAVVALENMDLSAKVTISQNAFSTWEKAAWAKAGDVLTVEQLLYGLMVQSENQAAVALAEGCAGSVEAFVRMMNAKAANLGMSGTHYMNPHGLDDPGRHYSTASDLATLARYAMSNEAIGETFRKLAQTKEYTTQIPGHNEPTVFRTTNELMLQNDWVSGVKTGDTEGAGICLVAAGVKDGVSMVSVVLGAVDHPTCFKESKDLLEYGMSQYRYVTVLEEGAPLAEATIPYHSGDRLQLVTKAAVGMELYKTDSFTASVVVDKSLVLPVKAGDVFGRVEMSKGGQVVGTVDLVASQSFGKPTLGTKIANFFDDLFH